MKVIAEIGSNWKTHEDCRKSIQMAKLCGADIVKFQSFTAKDLHGVESSRELSPALTCLKDIADEFDIEFMCTAFSCEGYSFINPLVRRHKVASAEITAIDLLETVNSFKKPVLLSTGGATLAEIETAVAKLKDCPVTILYCVTDYPARIVDFRHLEILKEHFGGGYSYGYSDHSSDVLNIPILARKHGSVILEKHVNFTDHTDTPDAPHSLNTEEFAMMVKHLKGELSPVETLRPCPWKRVKTEHGYFRPS